MFNKRIVSASIAFIGLHGLAACSGSGGTGADLSAASSGGNASVASDAPIAPTPAPLVAKTVRHGQVASVMPGNFRLEGNDGGTVTVAWNESTKDLILYGVQWRASTEHAWKESPWLAPGTTNYTLPKLPTGSYVVRVYAKNSAGTVIAEPLKVDVIADQTADGSKVDETNKASKAPSVDTVTVAATTGDSVTINWPSSPDAQGYRVEHKGPDWEGWAHSGLLPADASSYQVTGLWRGKYLVRVQAFTDNGALVSTSEPVTADIEGTTSTNETAVNAAASSEAGEPASKGSAAEVQATSLVAEQPENKKSSGTLNNVDTILDDMRGNGAFKLANISSEDGWRSGRAYNIMGNVPTNQHAPSYWRSECGHSGPSCNTDYHTDSTWNYAIPWLVVFEGGGNGAYNTRIQLRNLQMYIKYKSTGSWTKVDDHSDDIDGTNCGQNSNYLGCRGGVDRRKEASGGISILPAANMNFHGYGALQDIRGWDIEAVFVTVQSRLIPNGGEDDRGAAKYMLQAGGDYYATPGEPDRYLPAIALSRTKRITSDWQAFNMVTLSDVGIQEPGGGMSEQAFRSNPPPLQ